MLFLFLLVSLLNAEQILLTDIKSLTFVRNAMTTARRTSPIPQLKCIGGDACKLADLLPKKVNCRNVGVNGIDVRWKCVGVDLDPAVRLGRVTVSCEGIKNADDPNVLIGSCGLEYWLHKKTIVAQSIEKPKAIKTNGPTQTQTIPKKVVPVTKIEGKIKPRIQNLKQRDSMDTVWDIVTFPYRFVLRFVAMTLSILRTATTLSALAASAWFWREIYYNSLSSKVSE